MTNSIVWTLYAILKHDYTILVPNFTGACAGIFCVYSFHMYSNPAASPPAPHVDVKYYAVSGTIIAFSLLMALLQHNNIIGSLGVVLAVILMGSPLATLRTVIETKSTVSIPFYTSLATWCNAFSWTLYGVIDAHDVMVWLPNAIGFILASFQMLLFLIFGLPNNGEVAAGQRDSILPRSLPGANTIEMRSPAQDSIYTPIASSVHGGNGAYRT